MRKSQLTRSSAHNHTLRFEDEVWKKLQLESIERKMSISDIIVEALQSRVIMKLGGKK